MSRLLHEFYHTPLAIVPSMIAPIRDVLTRHAAGVKLSEHEIAAAVGRGPAEAAARRTQPQPRGVFVLPVLGVLSQRGGIDQTSTPLTSVDSLRRHFAAALADSEVGTILLDVDSPGGSVAGIQEFAADIFAARGQKRIVAQANSLMASAAYWIGSAADEVVATPSGQVGSIGVISAHEDHSGELEQKGIRVELISAGRYKTEGSPLGPLTDEARADRQRHVDEYYRSFTNDVAKHRNVKPADVRSGYGQGRVLGARDALAAGMVDRIGTLEQTIGRLLSSAPGPARRSARAEFDEQSAIAMHATDRDLRAPTPHKNRLERELAVLEAEHATR
jgi:signal peptide peptidase SppA